MRQNTQVRERGDQLMPKSEMMSPWTEVLQTPGAYIPLTTCGDVHFPHVERFQILEDSLTSGENSLVYSSVLMCKYLMVCFEAQTSTNHAVGISQSHQHWQLIYVDLEVKFLM